MQPFGAILKRSTIEEGINRSLNLLERLVRARRRLQSSLAINQKNGRVACDGAIKLRNVSLDSQKRVTYRHLLQKFLLQIDALV